MARPSPHSSLLGVPAEVRLRIYHFLIPQGHRLRINFDNSHWYVHQDDQSGTRLGPRTWAGATLFRVHSTCYHETYRPVLLA
jgi:hypothetical protein